MLLKTFILGCIPLISQTDIVTILIVVVVIFSFLLILGVRKSYKLKKENDRLNSMNTTIEDENKKPYKDFTDGHMYGGN
ncbi:hypothetical protein [Jejuia spongiicola]|uniref:LPXTG cell wall anchor domain-containing protein n=1 Tax=Jejuia spongiicola TaxID=2942207 RepID=A0ABT0QE04_9FLAO|nr:MULTISPECIES: hypothetical protein [Flavobacteriaceae]MCL6295212.1 hypothetical protein [Jejuia spongiicola]PIA77756.1 hypothetical protein BFR04_10005 [Gaetbulibacter sp. 4G1]